MARYRGNNLDRIYKASNNAILNSGLDISNKQIKGCLSKVGYDTEFEAEVNASKRRLNAYKCLYCPHYHLTRQSKKEDK